MAFCFAPFMHRYVDTRAKSFLCCAQTKTEPPLELEDWEGEDYQRIRHSMLSDEWLPECVECKEREESGISSSRMAYNKFYSDLGQPELNIVNGTSYEVPISYDLRMNNLCNLSCRMCGPESSSQLQKEAKQHPHLWPTYQNEENYNNMNVEYILDNAENMFELKLLGGEPTVQPETKAILQRLIDVGNTRLRLNMTTNGTNVNANYYDLIKQFKNVFIQVSIDHYGPGHEYIRGPAADFPTIWNNVKRIYEQDWAGNFSIQLAQSVQTFQIFDFWKLRQEAFVQYPWLDSVMSFIVYGPKMYSPRFIPKEWKEKAIDIAKAEDAYEGDRHIFHIINQYDTDLDHIRELKAHTELMDFTRGQHLKDYFPHVHSLLQDIE